ncbi:MAG: polysulfide reductase NrfD, partial [Proteobacteria bacterium]|nr:polysulfide reductase NrfD [Pseudomonadota bacterium]
MPDELLITARANPMIDPGLAIWGWQISTYLFLGGLTAGIMLFSALMLLMRKDREAPFAVQRLALLAPIALSLGMAALFLDLEFKRHVYRFYFAFRPTSPMSYGAWILILIYPVAAMQILSTVRAGFPATAARILRYPPLERLVAFLERQRRLIAALAIPLAVALGIYTGILLSAFSARPLWNAGLLGPLFLVSGLSTGAALTTLLAREHGEVRLFTAIDVGLILAELAIVGLWLASLASGPRLQLDALGMLLRGGYAAAFWGLFVAIGLLLPLALDWLELRGRLRRYALVAPSLVLLGGLA